MHDRDAEWSFFRFARFVDPYPAHWLYGLVQVHIRNEFQPFWWCQVFYAIYPGCLFSGIFLGHPSYCYAFCTPGRGEEFLKPVGCRRFSTGRCLIASLLELEHPHFQLVPGDGVPFIPMTCIMVHDVSTLLSDSIFHTIVPLWAYPSCYRGHWLRGRSLHNLTLAGLRRPAQCDLRA